VNAAQLALDVPGKPPEPEQWGVVVDEIMLNSLGRSVGAWWVAEAGSFSRIGKLRRLATSLPGAVVELGPFPLDDAEFIRDYVIEQGAHPKVLKVRKWTEQPHLPRCSRAKRCRLCVPTSAAGPVAA
jgi:hypothetical protein